MLSKEQHSAKRAEIAKLIEQGKTNGEIMRELKPAYGEIDRQTVIFQREKLTRPTELPMGRKRCLPLEVIENSRKKVTESTSIRTTGEIIATVKDEHVIFREKHNQNHLALPSISDRTYRNIARSIAPEIIKNPLIQSPDREKVMNDLYTGISQAVISRAIQGIVPTDD